MRLRFVDYRVTETIVLSTSLDDARDLVEPGLGCPQIAFPDNEGYFRKWVICRRYAYKRAEAELKPKLTTHLILTAELRS